MSRSRTTMSEMTPIGTGNNVTITLEDGGRVVTVSEIKIRDQAATFDEDIVGRGKAVCSPDDHFVEKIGQRISTARALKDYAEQLERRWSERSVTKAEVDARRHKTDSPS